MWGGDESNITFNHAFSPRVSLGLGTFAYLGPWSMRVGVEAPSDHSQQLTQASAHHRPSSAQRRVRQRSFDWVEAQQPALHPRGRSRRRLRVSVLSDTANETPGASSPRSSPTRCGNASTANASSTRPFGPPGQTLDGGERTWVDDIIVRPFQWLEPAVSDAKPSPQSSGSGCPASGMGRRSLPNEEGLRRARRAGRRGGARARLARPARPRLRAPFARSRCPGRSSRTSGRLRATSRSSAHRGPRDVSDLGDARAQRERRAERAGSARRRRKAGAPPARHGELFPRR